MFSRRQSVSNDGLVNHSLQTADKGRTFKIPSSDHLSYCWREKILSLLQNFIISYLPLINNVQTHMHKNNTYVAADIRCFPKSPWNKMNNVFIAFTDESRVAAICNGWWNVSSFQDYNKLYFGNWVPEN